ncbi:MAG: ribosome assembly RNA-binding protein YhbY [Gammaproteobacteria bacterium]|nr:ribosome assembly RNA-binding protein YhbY [Gammaproteobacteria bacterium]
MLSSATRHLLRAKAHILKPVVLLGAKGLTPAVMQEIDIALEAHELIKVKLTKQDKEARVTLAQTICQELHAESVQAIGLILVLYRKKQAS